MSDKVSLGKSKCIKTTDKAVLVYIYPERGERWIPQSCVHDDSEVYKMGDVGDLVVHLWWAEQNGFA